MHILGINNYYQPKYLNKNQQQKVSNPQQFQTRNDMISFSGLKVLGFNDLHNFINIENPQNKEFYYLLKKKFNRVPYPEHDLHYSHGKLFPYVIRNVYKSCLDSNNIVNKHAAETLFNICHVEDSTMKGLDIPEWNIKEEKSKIYKDWGLNEVANVLELAKDKNNNHNINNLKFLLYLDKSYGGDLKKALDTCKENDGIISDRTFERFKSIYKDKGGSSIIYDMSIIKDLSDRGMAFVKLIQSKFKNEFIFVAGKSQDQGLYYLLQKALIYSKKADRDKVFDILTDNLGLICNHLKDGREDIINAGSYSGSNNNIIKRSLGKDKKINVKNLKLLFEFEQNGEDDIYGASEFLKDKNGIIRRKNFDSYKKISEYIYDTNMSWWSDTQLSDLVKNVKDCKDADGNWDKEFVNKLVEMCQKYDIRSPYPDVNFLIGFLTEANNTEKIDWDVIDTLYEYYTKRVIQNYTHDEETAKMILNDFKDSETGKFDLSKIELIKNNPNKTLFDIHEDIENQNRLQTYIKNNPDYGNLYTAEDMLDLLRDLQDENILKSNHSGNMLTYPIADNDICILMYIADIMPTAANEKKYDKILNILSKLENVNYNYKDSMGISFLEKVMMCENDKLLKLIENKRLEYLPELDYVFENIQNPEFKEKVKKLNIILKDTQGVTAKDINTPLKALALTNSANQ